MRPTRLLLIAVLPMVFEPVDPLMGCLPRDLKPFSQLRDGVVVQPVLFEQPFPLLAHGNTFPRHGRYLPLRKCYPCP
jgi:hypothetical protein